MMRAYGDDDFVQPSAVPVVGCVVFNTQPFDAEDVRRRRDATGEGMMEAKKKLRIKAFVESFDEFRSEASMEDKIDFILDWIKERETG